MKTLKLTATATLILVLVTFMNTTNAQAGKDRAYSVNLSSNGVGFSYNKGSHHGKDHKSVSLHVSSPRHYTSNYTTRYYGSTPDRHYNNNYSAYTRQNTRQCQPQPRRHYVQGYWDTYTVRKFSHYEYVKHYDRCGNVHYDKQPVYRNCTERRWIPGKWVYR